MSCRCGISGAAVAVLLLATLGACSEYLDRRDTISIVSGEAMAANRVTHMIDPWPPHSARRAIVYNGEKAATASERYRTGRVIPPVNATTSSAAYTEARQAVESLSNSQASASGNKNNK